MQSGLSHARASVPARALRVFHGIFQKPYGWGKLSQPGSRIGEAMGTVTSGATRRRAHLTAATVSSKTTVYWRMLLLPARRRNLTVELSILIVHTKMKNKCLWATMWCLTCVPYLVIGWHQATSYQRRLTTGFDPRCNEIEPLADDPGL